MPRFSANLGFLWTEKSLSDGIRAAAAAGFHAVECHFPYAEPVADVRGALADTGLSMLSVNTVRGAEGQNGLAAVPACQNEARQAIDQALSTAEAIDAAHIHIMAGIASGQAAEDCFIGNLIYGAQAAAALNKTILIEPLNPYDAPDYFLSDIHQARAIIDAANQPNIKLMFDIYHMQILHGNLTRLLETHLDIIGHIQFASVPDRGAPDRGEVNFPHLFEVIDRCGWTQPLGAEYKPATSHVEDSLGWLQPYI